MCNKCSTQVCVHSTLEIECVCGSITSTQKTPPKTIDTEPVACDEYVYLNLISFSQNFRKKCTCLLATTTIIFGTACIVSK